MRIVLLIVAGFLLIAGAGFYLSMSTIRDDIERQYSQAAEEPLVDFAHLLASLAERDVVDGRIDVGRFRTAFAEAREREFVARIYRLEKTEIQTHVYIADRDGIILFDSEGGVREGENYSQYNDVFLAREGKYGVRSSRTDPDDPRTSVFYVAAPIREDGELVGTLSVSRPETAMAPFAEESKQLVVRTSALAAAIVLALTAVWAWFVLHPIRSLTRHALRIADGKQATLPPTGMAELRTLSLALETMRRELEGKHYVENYVQALTHELKSPLAAIRGAAELIDEDMPEEKRRRFLDNILVETARSEDLVRRLVQLAAVESRTSLEAREKVDLGALFGEEIDALAGLAETRSVRMERSGFDEAPVIDGDPLMLRIAIRNALANAIDFSPPEGTVTVSLFDEHGVATCLVQDEGPGVPEYAEGRVFDRFYSLKNEVTGRKGSGIGLSFVRAAMELHGGSASLVNRKERGAELRMRFG